MRHRAALPLLLVLALAGCGGEGDVSITDFVDACVASGGLTRAICECVGSLAAAELSPEGIAFLTATMTSEAARAGAFEAQLDMQETMAAGMFMVNAPGRCVETTN